jgi:hypothetical protein
MAVMVCIDFSLHPKYALTVGPVMSAIIKVDRMQPFAMLLAEFFF